MEGCIFCAIARGDMPARRVWEDDVVVAFDDINPQAPVHTLIIPRSHYRDLEDAVPVSVLSALFGAVPAVARARGVAEGGYRVIVNTGRDANQSVPHLHVHVLGGREMSHGMLRFTDE